MQTLLQIYSPLAEAKIKPLSSSAFFFFFFFKEKSVIKVQKWFFLHLIYFDLLLSAQIDVMLCFIVFWNCEPVYPTN